MQPEQLAVTEHEESRRAGNVLVASDRMVELLESGSMPQPDQQPRMLSRDLIGYYLIIAGVAAVCLNHLGAYRPLTHHEVYVAQTAREMWQNGNWLLPTYFGAPRYQKPPLAYWQTLASYHLFGVANDWTARLPAALTGITLALLVATVCGKRYGARTGWMAGFVQATSVYFLIQARLAEADITVAFAVAAALFCYAAFVDRVRGWHSLEMSDSAAQESPAFSRSGTMGNSVKGLIARFSASLLQTAFTILPLTARSRRAGTASPARGEAFNAAELNAHGTSRNRSRSETMGPIVWGFWLSLVIATLAKGPVGPLMIVSVVFVHSLIGREWHVLRQLCRPTPMLAALLLIGVWPASILWQDRYAGQVWLKESAGRFLRDPNDVVRHSFYYPLASLWLTLPWTPLWLLGLACSHWRKPGLRREHGEAMPSATSARRDSFERLLVLWLLIPMGLLSLSAGKQEHYLIPALIPCSIWAAIGLRTLICRFRQRAPAHWWEAGGWLLTTDRRLIGTAWCLVLAIVMIQTWVLPQAHGRRTYAEFAQSELGASPSQSTILLGHSVQWLAFYAPGRTVRCDSLEELFRRYGAAGGAVVATRADAEAIAAHLPVFARQNAPWDGSSSPRKQPVLLRFAPTSGALAN